MPDAEHDAPLRLAAFARLAELAAEYGGLLPARALKEGFVFRDERVLFKGIQGIFKPAQLPPGGPPLSITTAAPSLRRGARYDDHFDEASGRLFYRYRGSDPNHPDNKSLRAAWRRGAPLIYFNGIVEREYLAAWPVYVVADEPAKLRCHVLLDDAQHLGAGAPEHAGAQRVAEASAEPRRQYITGLHQTRAHQAAFRARVLRAYRQRCSLCRLRHAELLDAAHITPDRDPRGAPVVPNGIALCKLHHAAFDKKFIGIHPEKKIAIVRPDLLEERDGPMLKHGLQGLHEKELLLPRHPDDHPDLARLAARYVEFRASARLL